jgi:hypothetical protein
MRRVFWAVALAWGLSAAAAAQDVRSVDLELVLLADASGSIDDAEIRFQRQGYAAAITHPEVLWAIAQGYDRRIAVTYVEWGMVGSQDVVVPWTIVDGARSAAAFAEALIATPRRAFGRNAMGEALAFGQALIESNEVDGYRKVIDLSADSANSWSGPSIAEARASALAADISTASRSSAGTARAGRIATTSRRRSPSGSSAAPAASRSPRPATGISPMRCARRCCWRSPVRIRAATCASSASSSDAPSETVSIGRVHDNANVLNSVRQTVGPGKCVLTSRLGWTRSVSVSMRLCSRRTRSMAMSSRH